MDIQKLLESEELKDYENEELEQLASDTDFESMIRNHSIQPEDI